MRAHRAASILGAGACLAGAWTAAAIAAPDGAATKRAPELQAIVDCRALTDRDARLNCYDSAAAKLDQAEAAGQVVVVNREQVRQVRKDVFGLQLPSLDIFSAVRGKGPVQGEDLDRVTDVAKAVTADASGRWTIALDSGAVWRQTDNSALANDPHLGSKIEIRQGALGSFFMKVDGQPAFRVHRDR